jgi:hypothetical protein
MLAGIRSALTAATVFATGCGEAGGGPAASVRDSAGVTIVENPAALAERPLWTVAPEPMVEIGALEGDEPYQLSQVAGAIRLGDGRLLIANRGTQELRYYDPTGRHLLTVGREGEGPGEFRGLGMAVAGAGDTVVAYDFNLRRLSYFGPDGTFLRSVALRFEGGFPVLIGPLADGAWLSNRGFTFSPGADGSDVIRDTVPFLVFDSTGTLRDSVGRFPQFEYYVETEGSAAWASSLPFGRATEAATWRDRFYAGHTARYEIARYTTAGVPELVIRLEYAPVPVTGADVDTLKAERMEGAQEQWRQRTERMFQKMPIPATFPAFADLTVDTDGHLWVLGYTRPGRQERRWTVFSPEGRALGSVETPPGLRVLDIGHDYVVGVWRDDLDVEYVRMHRLDRTGP